MSRRAARHLLLPLLALLAAAAIAGAQERTKELTLDDLGKFSGRGVRGFQWIEGGKAYSCLESDTARKKTDLWKYEAGSGRKTKLVDASELVLTAGDPPFAIQNYTYSPDESRILFTGTLSARALKTGGNFFLYDIKSRKFSQLTHSALDQMNVKFSPDGKQIGFVRAHNLYTLELSSGKETQLTSDGSDHRFNGHFDWVYEEEFSIIDGWQWSPDGASIAYWQLDENRVPEFPIVNFIPLHQEITRQRYPKPGDPNAMVRIGVVKLSSAQTTWMDLGAPFDTTQDFYLPRMGWTPDGKLLIHRMNRHQNLLEVLLADPSSGATTPFLKEAEETWVDIKNDFLFLKKSKGLIWPSERNGYLHLYLYDEKGTLVRQLTKGTWDVGRIVGVDEEERTLYFTAAVTTPLDRDLYAVNLDGTHFRRVTRGSGTHSITAAPGMRCFLDNFSNVDTPPKLTIIAPDGSPVRVVDEGSVPALAVYRLSPQTFFTFLTPDSVSLNGWMIKPPDFDPAKKYPVLMTVYGGPGSQTVTNTWGGAWNQLLAQKGIIVASVDGRGTGARGKAFKSVTYKHLGTWETNDQIAGAKYLASLPYVDGGRIGITGGSYGGYMTLMCLLKGSETFKLGIAVSSVTHWKFYDSIYTERYMLTPKENPDGYAESAPATYADRLKGKLLIMHGTDDDNVHMQNSITMIDELVKKNKQFQTSLYPGSKHGIRARQHYLTTILNYLMENL
jgi:dipeptidyl-peptidase-4